MLYYSSLFFLDSNRKGGISNSLFFMEDDRNFLFGNVLIDGIPVEYAAICGWIPLFVFNLVCKPAFNLVLKDVYEVAERGSVSEVSSLFFDIPVVIKVTTIFSESKLSSMTVPRIILTLRCNFLMRVIGIVGTDKCVISCVDNYRKNKKFLQEDIFCQRTEEELLSFAGKLSEIAGKNGMKMGFCFEKIDLSSVGIEHNCCIDKEIIKNYFSAALLWERIKIKERNAAVWRAWKSVHTMSAKMDVPIAMPPMTDPL